MTHKDTPSSSPAATLRQRAEAQFKANPAPTAASLSPAETQPMLHELQVHQIELEMQNEELQRIQLELETSQARYFDLYDLAPIGYVTLSNPGVILEANLTAAGLLGVARNTLVGQPLTHFMVPDDQDLYYRPRKRLLELGGPQACELRLLRPDGAFFWARLEMAIAPVTDGERVGRVVISDITTRVHAEQERRQAEAEIRQLNEGLEQRIAERTVQLETANRELRGEMAARRHIEATLRESEARLKNSQQVAHVGHWSWNLQTQEVVGSDELYRIFGLEPGTFTGGLDDMIRRSVHPDDQEKVFRANAAWAAGQRPGAMEYRVVWPDQSVHSLWAAPGESVAGLDGRALTLTGIVQDITDRKQAEQLIRDQKERLQAQNDELAVKREMLQSQNQALATQETDLRQARDGLEVRVHERTDELKKANTVLGEQIEERRQAEALVRQSAQRMTVLAEVSQALAAAGPNYRAALDQVARAIAVFIGDASAIRLLSDDPQRLDLAAFHQTNPEVGEATRAFLAAGSQGVAEGIVGRVFQTKQPVFLPALSPEDLRQQVRPSARLHLDQVNVAGLIVAPLLVQTEVLGTLAVYRTTPECPYTAEDLKLVQSLADRVALAIANAQLYWNLEHALAQEKAVRQQLVQAEKLGAMGRLIGSVAHELNNPLQTITNCLYLTAGELPAESPIHEYLDMATSETERLTGLVAQLREVYRPRLVEQPERLDLLQQLVEVQRLLAPQLERQHVQWHLASQAGEALVNGLPDQLKQVFINLSQNAAEAMQPAGGGLTVEVTLAEGVEGSQVSIAFRDTGPGIPPENLDRLFEPFYTTKPTGLGLGLSICNDIVQQHGGQITVESQLGQGAVFTLRLPLAQPFESGHNREIFGNPPEARL